jgi:lipid-binding SYLF domain-containing protein
MNKLITFAAALVFSTLSSTLLAFEPDINDSLELDVARAINDVKKADPGIETFFENAAGYAVYPSVGKGGLVVGGAYGKGKYAQFVFFRDQIALEHFKRGNFEFGAQASAVAITKGASTDANYDKGVIVFTHAGGGLMVEGTVGGQKFTYEPKNQ